MAVDWDYFDKYDSIINKYMSAFGEGETKASQIVTAVNKLIYKWYNDGDVFDNTYLYNGWLNDLSSYANWLDQNTEAGYVLAKIKAFNCDYEELLAELARVLLDDSYLEKQNEIEKVGSIYKCSGQYVFKENDYEDDYDDFC